MATTITPGKRSTPESLRFSEMLGIPGILTVSIRREATTEGKKNSDPEGTLRKKMPTRMLGIPARMPGILSLPRIPTRTGFFGRCWPRGGEKSRYFWRCFPQESHRRNPARISGILSTLATESQYGPKENPVQQLGNRVKLILFETTLPEDDAQDGGFSRRFSRCRGCYDCRFRSATLPKCSHKNVT